MPHLRDIHSRPMTRRRWMALSFALGSLCFLVGPFPGYAQLVGAAADGVTFFVGSILFTIGGALSPTSRGRGGATSPGRPDWLAAIIQSAGTLFFNVTTYQALHTSLNDSHYDRLVWRPDAFGSICFLVSGAIAYRASDRHGWLPVRGETAGGSPRSTCSGASSSGSRRSPATSFHRLARSSISPGATANTALGAACFLACASRHPPYRPSRRRCPACTASARSRQELKKDIEGEIKQRRLTAGQFSARGCMP